MLCERKDKCGLIVITLNSWRMTQGFCPGSFSSWTSDLSTSHIFPYSQDGCPCLHDVSMLYRSACVGDWIQLYQIGLIWSDFVSVHLLHKSLCFKAPMVCVWLAFKPVNDMAFTFPWPIAFLSSWCVVGLCILLFPLATHWSVCSMCPLCQAIGLAPVTVGSSYLLPSWWVWMDMFVVRDGRFV